MQHIEVTPAGTYIFVAGTDGTTTPTTGIHPVNLSSSPIAIGTAFAITGSIKELQYVSSSSKLYFTLTNSSTDIRTLNWGGTPIALTNNTVIQSVIGSWVATHKSGSDLYWATTTDIFKNGTAVSGSFSFVSSGAMILADSKFYVLDNVAATANLKVFNSSYGSIHNISGVCAESGTITIGSKSRPLHIKAKSDESVYRMWESGFEFLGRRNVVEATDSIRYYFRQLSPHGDEVSNGGYLRRPQQMLSPQGISGLFSDFASCGDLATAVAAAGANGIVRSQTIFNALTGQFQTYGVTAKQNITALDTYLCEDDPSSPVTCNTSTDKFSLELSFGAMNSSYIDQSVLKISCSRKLGTMESLEFQGGELRRELLKWNTGDTMASRYEVYSLEDQSNEDRASIVKFQKVTDDSSFVARQISAMQRSGEVEANIKEYQRSSAQSQFNFRQANLREASVTNFISNTHSSLMVFDAVDFDTVKTLNNFSSYTPAFCLSTTTASTQGTSNTCSAATMSTLPSSTMSAGSSFDLNTMDLIDFNNNTHQLQDGSVFEIPDP
jgi:hypothetical protein